MGVSWLYNVVGATYISHAPCVTLVILFVSPYSALTTFRKETEEGHELELHNAEVSALMNLVATDTMVEEAVALIPSLSKFPEAAIDEILDLIRSTMMRIVS